MYQHQEKERASRDLRRTAVVDTAIEQYISSVVIRIKYLKLNYALKICSNYQILTCIYGKQIEEYTIKNQRSSDLKDQSCFGEIE